jgi:hypothetical protein
VALRLAGRKARVLKDNECVIFGCMRMEIILSTPGIALDSNIHCAVIG